MKNPFYYIRNWHYLISKFINELVKLFPYEKKGVSIFNEEWNSLIILDACRYDFFKKLYIKRKLPGNLFKKNSLGTNTVDFLIKNFTDNEYKDIIYITANPFVDQFLKNKFHKLVSVWKSGWNHTHHTVLPKTMYDQTRKTFIENPDKKFIIHFMQPHYPFIGYNKEDGSLENVRRGIKSKGQINLKGAGIFNKGKLYAARIYRLFDEKTLIEAYEKNLELVFNYLEKLINLLPGKIIITADHGEALGESIRNFIPIKYFGHGVDFKIKPLLEIPWLVIGSLDQSKEKIKLKSSIKKFKTKNII
jgi:membrane-anchored protein YejM (alkaline phosphatase superfamily)